MLGLLSLTTVKEWFWAGLLVAAGIFCLHIYHAGERHETAALAVQSAQLLAAAQKQLDATQATYSAALNSLEEKLDAQTKAAAAQHTADAQRLRDFDAYRRAHPALGCAAGGSDAPRAGAGCTVGTDDIVTRLEQVALELAQSARDAANALGACIAERDTLTGK